MGSVIHDRNQYNVTTTIDLKYFKCRGDKFARCAVQIVTSHSNTSKKGSYVFFAVKYCLATKDFTAVCGRAAIFSYALKRRRQTLVVAFAVTVPVMSKRLKSLLVIGGLVGLIGVAVYPIIVHPKLHSKQYSEQASLCALCLHKCTLHLNCKSCWSRPALALPVSTVHCS